MTTTLTMALPRELTIYTAGETRHALAQWIAAAPADTRTWVLDGHAVAEADAAGAQMLMALVRSAAAAGTGLRVDAASDALHDACRRLGIDVLLGLDQPHAEHA